jgi:hypothetical protein
MIANREILEAPNNSLQRTNPRALASLEHCGWPLSSGVGRLPVPKEVEEDENKENLASFICNRFSIGFAESIVWQTYHADFAGSNTKRRPYRRGSSRRSCH